MNKGVFDRTNCKMTETEGVLVASLKMRSGLMSQPPDRSRLASWTRLPNDLSLLS